MQDPAETADLVTREVLQIQFARIKADLRQLKWMLGVIVAAVLALVLKAFLHI